VSLSGTGAAEQHEVDLTWDAPSSSPVPVAGYDVYRSTGGSAFQLLNSSLDTQTAYVDSTVQSGKTYSYEVESVDASGMASSPSNQITVTIP
jgi:fibronectin type 3 domain-containing protein